MSPEQDEARHMRHRQEVLAGKHITSSGIVIGRAYIKPAPRELGSEAERIQTALLAKQKFSVWLMRFRVWKACLGRVPF